MSLPPLHKVIIIGGSLTGLMHALTLLTHIPSIQLLILERSPSNLLHNQGAGVVASPVLQTFFERYVVCPDHAIAVESKERLYLDRAGNVVEGSVEVRSQKMTSWDLLFRLLRHRVDGRDASEYLSLEERGRVEEVLRGEEGVGKGGGGFARYENGCFVESVEDAGDEGVRVGWRNKDGEMESATADFVFAADGASSGVRRQLLPSVERKYVGYVAWRGTVEETRLSPAAMDVFVERFPFFHSSGLQVLGYLIPGENGALAKGKRLANWVWYCNYEEGSAEYEELMTDKDGKRHAVTLPVGGMKDKIWERQKKYASEVLPPQFAELVNKTEHPFIQAITDVISPENELLNSKVLLVGDALAGFRPHTAASTGQAAFDALTLAELLEGTIDRSEYSKRVLQHATEVQKHGVMLGERSQFGRHPFAM